MWVPDGRGGGAADPVPYQLSPVEAARGAGALLVRNGGVTVSTDAMLTQIPLLRSLANAIDYDRYDLLRMVIYASPTSTPLLESCIASATRASETARGLADALIFAEGAYASVESSVGTFVEVAAQWSTAVAARMAVLTWPWSLFIGMRAKQSWDMVPGTDAEKAAALQRWIADNPQVYTNPEFVRLVELATISADDAALGALGVSPLLLAILGPNGLGVHGVDTSARSIMAARALGDGTLLRETPVKVTQVGPPVPGTPPAGAADRATRIPDSGEQIRIDVHSTPGEPDRYMVYISPTVTFSPDATTEPWDLTSNVAAVAGLSSGAMRATELAMEAVGITAESEVGFVGYSQGGLVADQLTASGNWNVKVLETYGSPNGGIDLPEGVAGVTVRHSDDFIPATGGPQFDQDHLTVERRVFPDADTIPSDTPAPAHAREEYEKTAQMLDAATSPELRTQVDATNNFTDEYAQQDGSHVTTYIFHAERD